MKRNLTILGCLLLCSLIGCSAVKSATSTVTDSVTEDIIETVKTVDETNLEQLNNLRFKSPAQ